MDLSVIIPAFERVRHLEVALARLEVNALNFPNIDFEVIVINGNSEKHPITKLINNKMCNTSLQIQHIFCNFGKWVNPSLPRNIAFKYATGKIFTMIDIDHYVGENFILGATVPWNDNNFTKPILNYGFMIDTCYSHQLSIDAINKSLLDKNCVDKIKLLEFCNSVGIKVQNPKSPWLLSYPSWAFNAIGGYDEDLLGWGREDDMFYLMLKEIGLKEIKCFYKSFCGLHLNHSKGGINGARNVKQNHTIFQHKKENLSLAIEQKIKKEWGKVPNNLKFWRKTNY